MVIPRSRILKRQLSSALDRARLRVRGRDRKPSGHFKGAYLLLSAQPPVLYVADWVIRARMFGIERIFRAVGRRRALFLVRLTWSHETRPYAVRSLRIDWEVHRRRFPLHRIVYLCNTPGERELFRDMGLEAIWCSSNAFADERIFRPLADGDRQFDAVYDARISAFKRHPLARDVRSLALISKKVGERDIEEYEAEVQRSLAHAHWFNNPFRSDFAVLSAPDVNDRLNRCRVGLCLSAQEGPMTASIQYLLAGLPVVSTPSLGGRDLFFDAENARVVDDTPAAVAAGVEELVAASPSPTAIRARTLERVMEHRLRLFELVQGALEEAGESRVFADEWPAIFRHCLLDSETDDREIVARIAAAARD
jgi:glycosyltransferase involved in cell wall biosynthesis